jgi:catecholate siderophore receptor
MNDRLARQLTSIIMAHGLSVAANAQSDQSGPAKGGTNNPAKLPDVVVKGQQEQAVPYKPDAVESPKYTEPLRDVPQTVTVVPRAVIEQQNATTLRDVLRNVPGISYQAGEGGIPAGDNLSIRGFSARTDLFVDNVRDFGGYSRDSFNLEQVEVSKGPASSYAGRGSTGGSINLVSKTPHLDPFYTASFGVGTEDYKRLTLDVNQPIPISPVPGTALRLNGMWTDTGTAGRDVIQDERWGLAPSLAFGLGTPTRVTLSYFHLDQDNLPGYGIPWVPTNGGPLAAYGNKPPPVDYSNFYGLKSDFERTRTDIPTALIEHDFNESFSLRNLTRYGRNDRDSVYTSPRFVDLAAGPAVSFGRPVNRQFQSRDQVDTIFANQTDLTSRFDTWRLNHAVVTSLEYAHETSINHPRSVFTNGIPITGGASATAPYADLFHPNPNAERFGPVRRTGAFNEAKADTVAVSLFDTIKFTEQWQLNGGVRFDHFDADFKAVGTNGLPTAGTPLSRTDDLVSWRAGLVYKPKPNGSIYAAYGTSFNPSAEGLSLTTNVTAASANFKTDPEESRTYEIGTKWDLFENRLALSLALFRTEKVNARTEDPADTADILVLKGKQRVDGIEVGAAGSITEKWKMFAGYAHMESEIVSSRDSGEKGNELSNTPENTFSLWTTYQLPWDLEIGGGAQFVDSRFSANGANRREAPGYFLFDATVGYNVSKNFSLRLNAYNLADKKYIDRVGGGHFIPGAGRSVIVTASLKF